MKKLIKGLLAIAVFVAVLGTSPVFAEVKVPERPSDSSVYDPNGYVDDHTEGEINKLNHNREEQVAVVVLDTLDGTSIEEFANKTARAWKIGYSDTNAGALVVISVRERKSRIETSNNFAVYVPDSETRRFLDDAKQLLRAEDYSGAVLDIAQELHASYQNAKQSESNTGEETSDKARSFLIGIVIVLSIIGSIVGILFALFIYTQWVDLIKRDRLNVERRSEIFEDRRATPTPTSGLQNSQTDRELDDLVNWSIASTIVESQLEKKNRSTSNSHSSSRNRNDDYSSSSIWSPSDWGGSGFDGGGSSSDW